MQPQQIGLTALVTLATVLAPFPLGLSTSFQASRVLAQTVDARKESADKLLDLCKKQIKTSQFQAALQTCQQALTIYRAINDPAGEGNSLGNLGIAYRNLGQHQKAIEFYQQVLAITRSIGDRAGEARSLIGLGSAYNYLGQYQKAIEFHQQALAITRVIGDRTGEAASLNNLGNAYNYLGQYQKAIESYQQTLAIARAISDRIGEANSLIGLGNAYNSLGQHQKAIEYFQHSLTIKRAIGDRGGEAASLGNLGNAYNYLGQHQKAIEYFQQALAITRSIGDRAGEARSLIGLGITYDSLGQYQKAIEFYQQDLAITRAIGDRSGEAASLGNLGVAYRNLGQYQKAIEFYQQDLAITRAIGDRSGEADSLGNLGIALFQTDKLAEAEKTLRDGVKVWESLRSGLTDADKVSIFEQQANTYRFLQQVLVAQKKTDTALEIAERGRARAFVELLATRLSSQRFLKEAIAPPTLRQIQQIAKAQNATLIEYSVIYDEFKVQGKQQLRESELYIWVIKPTGEVTFRQANLKPLWQQGNASLADLVTTTRDSIGVRGRSVAVLPRPNAPQARTQLQRLHQLLIQPIADLLPTDPNAHVIFVPQGELFLVPFPALQDKSGKYLLEKHTILTAPAIQSLNLTRQRRQQVSGKGALVVGNPTMPSVSLKIGEPPEKLSNLPNAEQEAKAIAPLLRTQAITGSKASETTIKQQMPRAKNIHLATHGLMDDFKGLGVPGAIALTPSGQDDGLLTASEILGMKLNAELVVLSACDTGRGNITGDGVIGLSRSLISAGVPSVVVSLWQVPDAPTASLMTQFYRNLQQNPDKAQALRQAMLKTMKQHPEPRNWAAFTLIGEAK